MENAKNIQGSRAMGSPYLVSISLSDRGGSAQNGGIAQTLYSSAQTLQVSAYLYKKTMQRKLSMGNSIYQQQGAGYGLTQKDGMLINNAPDGITGIAQAAQIKKDMKRMEKIQTMSEAVALGQTMTRFNRF